MIYNLKKYNTKGLQTYEGMFVPSYMKVLFCIQNMSLSVILSQFDELFFLLTQRCMTVKSYEFVGQTFVDITFLLFMVMYFRGCADIHFN